MIAGSVVAPGVGLSPCQGRRREQSGVGEGRHRRGWLPVAREDGPTIRSRDEDERKLRGRMSGTMLDGVRACVFDAYGTLFDFASAARGCGAELGDKAAALTALWRDK